MRYLTETDFPPLEPQPFVTEEGQEIERLRAELAAAIKQRDEAVELYKDLLRRLSGSTPPRSIRVKMPHAFLSGDASEKEGGGA